MVLTKGCYLSLTVAIGVAAALFAGPSVLGDEAQQIRGGEGCGYCIRTYDCYSRCKRPKSDFTTCVSSTASNSCTTIPDTQPCGPDCSNITSKEGDECSN